VTREERIENLIGKLGKGKAQRDLEHKKEWKEWEVEALQRNINEKSPYVKERGEIINRQKEEEKTADANETIRMGHAVQSGIGNRQSELDRAQRQNRYDRQARELLGHKYSKVSTARQFDIASSPRLPQNPSREK